MSPPHRIFFADECFDSQPFAEIDHLLHMSQAMWGYYDSKKNLMETYRVIIFVDVFFRTWEKRPQVVEKPIDEQN